MRKLRFIAGCLAVLCGGCSDDQSSNAIVVRGDSAASGAEGAPRTAPRFTVNIVATFHDDLAYDNERAIYTIKDAVTGREYFGISGVGIAETGSHMVGKNTIKDER